MLKLRMNSRPTQSKLLTSLLIAAFCSAPLLARADDPE